MHMGMAIRSVAQEPSRCGRVEGLIGQDQGQRTPSGPPASLADSDGGQLRGPAVILAGSGRPSDSRCPRGVDASLPPRQ